MSATLKNIEADGLVDRNIYNIYAEIPPKVEYSLKELGHSLIHNIARLTDHVFANFEKFKQQS